jgi:hypothetical protein
VYSRVELQLTSTTPTPAVDGRFIAVKSDAVLPTHVPFAGIDAHVRLGEPEHVESPTKLCHTYIVDDGGAPLGVQHVLPPYGGDGGHDGVNEGGAFSHVMSGVDVGTLLSV